MHNIDILKQLVFKGVDEKNIEITQEVSDRISKELTDLLLGRIAIRPNSGEN